MIGPGAIIPSEGVQHCLSPGSVEVGRQREDNAAAGIRTRPTGFATIFCGAIHDARGVKAKPALRTCPVATIKDVQYGLRPGSVKIRRQLEDRTTARVPIVN